jgi:hypothetical protein
MPDINETLLMIQEIFEQIDMRSWQQRQQARTNKRDLPTRKPIKTPDDLFT